MEKLTSYCVIALLAICTMVFFNYSEKSRILGTENGKASEFPFAFTELPLPDFPNNICLITNYDASLVRTVPENTEAIQSAIDDCNRKGGGTVIVPEGRWLIGGLKMKSNVNLHLTKGSRLVFSDNPENYLPAVFTRLEGLELYNYSPLIYANGIENAAITGEGILDGQGDSWDSWRDEEKESLKEAYQMAQDDVPVEERVFGKEKHSLRPSFIQFVNSKNIWLEDFHLTDGPKWAIHPLYSENVFIRNIDIASEGPNADGIVIDSSKNVLVEKTTIKSGDDSIAIKSGLDKDGWRVNRPSENIVIRDSSITRGHGGVAIGSEMSGGVKNVLVKNLKIDGVGQGLRVKSLKGRGGIAENVWVENLRIDEASKAGIDINLNYEAGTVESETEKYPTIRNFHIKDVTINKTSHPIHLKGLEKSPIQNISFSNISTKQSDEGIIVEKAKDIFFQGIRVEKLGSPSLFEIKSSENITR